MNAERIRHIEALIAAARASLAGSSLRSLSLSKPFVGAQLAAASGVDMTQLAAASGVDMTQLVAASGVDMTQLVAASGADKIMLRPIHIKGVLQLSVLYRFATKDITKNVSTDAGWQSVKAWLRQEFANAHLLTDTQDLQLITSRKGVSQLLRARAATPKIPASTGSAPAQAIQHDRTKAHLIALDAAFLQPLGITQKNPNGAPVLVPAMANKFKQINKFLEILHTALAKSQVADKHDLTVLDFGAGKGYLTFAIDHYLNARDVSAKHAVLGVELRAELVDAGNAICTQLSRTNRPSLQFVAGDVRSQAPSQLDVMVALHACDTATDYAIHFGIRQQAAIILCSPCCHKQLRPQMTMPNVLAPLLQHGVHLGQEAEMLTDGLRALLLEAAGYQTQVFEFIATEHTAKNKMILAIRRKDQPSNARAIELSAQITALKAFYGVREHCLEDLLASAR